MCTNFLMKFYVCELDEFLCNFTSWQSYNITKYTRFLYITLHSNNIGV